MAKATKTIQQALTYRSVHAAWFAATQTLFNQVAAFYFEVIKLWTGQCWSWIKVRISGRQLPEGWETHSPQLVLHGNHWWLHVPIERVKETMNSIRRK